MYSKKNSLWQHTLEIVLQILLSIQTPMFPKLSNLLHTTCHTFCDNVIAFWNRHHLLHLHLTQKIFQLFFCFFFFLFVTFSRWTAKSFIVNAL